MAEICCEVINRGEAAVAATASDACETTSRAARRRRIEVRRFKFVGGVDLPESSRKRQKVEVTAPIMEVAETSEAIFCSSLESVDDARSAKAETDLSNDSPTYGVMSVCGRRRPVLYNISNYFRGIFSLQITLLLLPSLFQCFWEKKKCWQIAHYL